MAFLTFDVEDAEFIEPKPEFVRAWQDIVARIRAVRELADRRSTPKELKDEFEAKLEEVFPEEDRRLASDYAQGKLRTKNAAEAEETREAAESLLSDLASQFAVWEDIRAEEGI